MRTPIAVVFNKESGFTRRMRAVEFESEFVGNPDMGITARQKIDLDLLETNAPDSGLPLNFRKSYRRTGDTEPVRATWVLPAGYGDHDHVLGPSQQESLDEAVQGGQRVLLSINMPLVKQDASFENIKERGAKRYEDWVTDNGGNYITVSIKSARQAVDTIKKVADLVGENLHRTVFAVHRGAVVPYANFYLGDQRTKMSQLFDAMQHGRSSVPLGESRIIGFPRLFAFVPSTTSMQASAKKGFKGNHLQRNGGKPFMNHLVIANPEEVKAGEPYRVLEEDISHGVPQHVLASPSTTKTNGDDGDEWHMLRWSIHDINTQTMPLDSNAVEKLLENARKHGYSITTLKEAQQLTLY